MAMMKLMSKLVQTLDCNLAFRLALDENLPTHLKNGIDPDYMRVIIFLNTHALSVKSGNPI